MEHIFVLNPAAGKRELRGLVEKIRAACERKGILPLLHETTAPGEGELFVREQARKEGEKRFYACGGDGTLHEVVNGCAGVAGAQLAVVPIGSGNDFIRSFGEKEQFLDLDAQLSGETSPIDTIRWNDRWAINLCNIGWDCDICRRTNKIKNTTPLHGSAAYIAAVGVSMLCRFGKKLTLTFEDGEQFEGNTVLAAIGNGSWYGGGFQAAPRALLNDGLLEVSTVSNVNRVQIMGLIGDYKAGRHLDLPKFQKFLRYRRAKQVRFESPEPFEVCADGEIYPVEKAVFSVGAQIPFLVPKGICFPAGREAVKFACGK